MAAGDVRVPDDGLVAGDPHELRRERRAVRGQEGCLDRPVLADRERPDLAFALDDEANRDGLHAAGREAPPDLFPR